MSVNKLIKLCPQAVIEQMFKISMTSGKLCMFMKITMRRDAFILNYFRVWEMAIPSGKIRNCMHGFPLECSTSCQHYRGI